MKTYIVSVLRTGRATRDIEVEADSADEAMLKAEDIAGDYEFNEHESEYDSQYAVAKDKVQDVYDRIAPYSD